MKHDVDGCESSKYWIISLRDQVRCLRLNLKSVASSPVRVRIPPSAPIISIIYADSSFQNSRNRVNSVGHLTLVQIVEKNSPATKSVSPSSMTIYRHEEDTNENNLLYPLSD